MEGKKKKEKEKKILEEREKRLGGCLRNGLSLIFLHVASFFVIIFLLFFLVLIDVKFM